MTQNQYAELTPKAKHAVASRRIFEILRDLEMTCNLTVSHIELHKAPDHGHTGRLVAVSIELS